MTDSKNIPRVVIESPYSGEIEANVVYATRCMQDSLKRGEAPYLSHLLYTRDPCYGHLPDDDPKQLVGRDSGLRAAHQWTDVCDFVAIYTDMGISKGMEAGLERAMKLGKRVEYRSLMDSEFFE